MLDWGLPVQTPGIALHCPACALRSLQAPRLDQALASDWQLNWILMACMGYPFTLWDCTNGFVLCMRAENPDGLELKATRGSIN